MARRGKKMRHCGPVIDSFETMRAEIAEAAELMRAHYPDDSAETLQYRAFGLRSLSYALGGWPAAIAAKKAEEEARARAEAVAKAAEEEAALIAESEAWDAEAAEEGATRIAEVKVWIAEAAEAAA